MPQDFTHAGYRALIEALLARGYEARSFADVEAQKPHLLLRHDLDMSLAAALPVAETERDIGVRAHYFVLLRSELYNPFSDAGKRAIERLLALGHSVGLHLDASLYGDSWNALEAAAERELRVLETLTGRPAETISFHRPARSLLGEPRRLAGRRHAYQPEFFKAIGYCSDSRGQWGHGHPLEHEAVRDGSALQLLTHPIWWSGEQRDDVQTLLERFARSRYMLMREELSRNCETFDARRLPPAIVPTETQDQ